MDPILLGRWAMVRILPGDPLFVIKPSYYCWRCVERGKEEEGVKILTIKKAVHLYLLSGIEEFSVDPPMNWCQRFCRLISCVWGFRWLRKLLPPPLSILDMDHGYDLLIEKETKHIGSSNGCPHYKVKFIQASKPAGTPEQMAAWQKTDVMESIHEPSNAK